LFALNKLIGVLPGCGKIGHAALDEFVKQICVVICALNANSSKRFDFFIFG
jgi:molybdopterin/thiamine biosynthesis adenylyltransferase